jgi:hypothetical protein
VHDWRNAVTKLRSPALAVAVVVTTVIPVAAQDDPPSGPFRAVHLVSLTPQQVAVMQAWMTDINAVLDKAGQRDSRYRLFKVIGKQAGQYDFMWESSWPSGDVYTRIHSSPEWRAVREKHPDVSALTRTETNVAIASVSRSG